MAFNWGALLGIIAEIGISEAGLFVKSASGQTILAAEEPIAQDLVAALVAMAAPMMTTTTAQTVVANMAAVHPTVVQAAQTAPSTSVAHVATGALGVDVAAQPPKETLKQENLVQKLGTAFSFDRFHAKVPEPQTGGITAAAPGPASASLL